MPIDNDPQYIYDGCSLRGINQSLIDFKISQGKFEMEDYEFNWVEPERLAPISQENVHTFVICAKSKDEMADISRTVSLAYSNGKAEIILSSGQTLVFEVKK